MVDDMMGVVGEFIPKVGTASSWASILTWLIIFTVLIIGATVASIIIILRLRYKHKIIVFEEINGQFENTRRDRAMEVRLSDSGDMILYLKKHKKYMPLPNIQTGRRVFWYFIRSDGEWINFGPTNLNLESKKLGARFLDKEMRFSRTALDRAMQKRYEKVGFMAKYGVLVFSIGFIAVLGVMMWLLFDKWIDLAATTNAGVTIAGEVMEKADRILSSLDNICSGGSGMIPAG